MRGTEGKRGTRTKVVSGVSPKVSGPAMRPCRTPPSPEFQWGCGNFNGSKSGGAPHLPWSDETTGRHVPIRKVVPLPTAPRSRPSRWRLWAVRGGRVMGCAVWDVSPSWGRGITGRLSGLSCAGYVCAVVLCSSLPFCAHGTAALHHFPCGNIIFPCTSMSRPATLSSCPAISPDYEGHLGPSIRCSHHQASVPSDALRPTSILSLRSQVSPCRPAPHLRGRPPREYHRLRQ